MKKIWSHRWLILALLIAIFFARQLVTTKHFYTHDDLQVYRVNEFIECFKRGEIPCRWATTLGKGYGYPWFNYYPPMIYIIPAVIHTLGVPLTGSLNLLMFGSFILAGWGMYLLVRELTGRDDLSALGSILYTLYPFHATNVFLRGVYGENLAWSMVPLILYLMTRQLKTGTFSRVLPLLLAFVFLTHLLSTFIVLAFVIGWQIFTRAKNWRHLLLQLALAFAFSAFFLVPALAEKNLVQTESLTQGYYSYLNHFVSFKQLFIEYRWNYGASYWGTPTEEMGYMVGHLHLVLLVLSLFGAMVLGRSKPALWRGLALIFTFFWLLFLTHSKSAPIWQLIPQLAYLQFPWRLLGWAGLPLTLAIVTLLSTIRLKQLSTFILVFIAGLSIYSYPFFFPRDYDHLTDQDFLSGREKYAQQDKALFDYLPKTVKSLPLQYADDSSAKLKVFYFPGWQAERDGQPVEIGPDPETGLIIPLSQSNSSELKLSWHETPLRLAMDLVSLFSLCGYLMYNIAYGKTRKA